MLWVKQIRGPYLCYIVEREFLTPHVLEQKPQMMQDVQKPEHDIALDIRKLHTIDALSLRFLVNVDELMEQKGHRLVLVGGEHAIVAQLVKARAFKHYSTMADFEREFHELNPVLLRSILQLAQGGEGFKVLNLECPICKFQEVSGFVLDEAKYQMVWSAREIVPVWTPITDEVEAIDYPSYKVSVCPECYFAAVRPDYFGIHFPEGDIKPILKPEQLTALGIGGSTRKSMANEIREAANASFFTPPRDYKAAYLSWKLYETCLKQMNPDRRFIDAFEVVIANFMMCKYAPSERLVDDHMHSALAWLNNVMQNQTHYSTNRLLQAHTYFVSVLLAIDKFGDAQRALAELIRLFGEEPDSGFWIDRAQALVTEAEQEIEAKK